LKIGLLLFLIFDVLILGLWYRSRKSKGKKLPWYIGWILPSDFITLSLLTVIGIFVTGKFVLDTFPLAVKRTESEISEIHRSITKYQNETGTLPTSLDELIGGNPLKKEWRADYWGTEYRLVLINESTYRLTSAGPDRQFNTEDDLVP
jgi:hypothetical protein